MYKHTHTHTHVRVWVCAHSHSDTHSLTQTHAQTHIHTHTHTHCIKRLIHTLVVLNTVMDGSATSTGGPVMATSPPEEIDADGLGVGPSTVSIPVP